ncbi:MAG TPA: hypothetical protein DGF30_07845 [Desulfomicrobium sp.]|nr:hypothetical protein [Desulfomicrobium sp.]
MTTHLIDTKKRLILEHEKELAAQLSTLVIDKPKPPLWMIFIPIFFVFFAQKMSQYKKSRENFVENHLKSRRIALEAAMEAEETGIPSDVEAIAGKVGRIPVEARPSYAEWMTTLIDHYRLLLSARGGSLPELVRSGYGSKTNYLLFCNCLNKAENAFSLALLPAMDGDSQDLRHVIQKMNESVTVLRRQSADAIFS